MSRITEIRFPVGPEGALVTYRLSDEDRSAGARICDSGRKTTCGACGTLMQRRDGRVYLWSDGSMCFSCAVSTGSLVKAPDPDASTEQPAAGHGADGEG